MKNTLQIFAILVLLHVALPVDKVMSQEASGETLAPLTSVEVPLRNISIAQGDAKVLDDVRSYLNSIKSLTADFTQQGADGKIARGKINFERPGKIRFEYKDELPLLIVSDGNIINFIDYDIGQITKWPINDTPLALLLAEEVNFNSHTTVSRALGDGGVEMLSITAKDPDNPQQGSLSLIFTKTTTSTSAPTEETLELRAWQVVDAQGILTTVSMSNIDFNGEINRDKWQFTDPRGNRATRNRRR